MKTLDIVHKGYYKTILLDDSDYYKYRRQVITIQNNQPRATVCRRETMDGKYKYIALHREIMGVTKRGEFVSFVDGNEYNLQKENLRVTPFSPHLAQTGLNKNPNSANYSQYRGVNRNTVATRRQTWVVNFNSKRYGGFTSEIEAAKWYDRLAKKAYGEHAVLNFPDDKAIARDARLEEDGRGGKDFDSRKVGF